MVELDLRLPPPLTARPARPEDIAYFHDLSARLWLETMDLGLEASALAGHQARIQHDQWAYSFPISDRLVLETEGQPIGRLYVERVRPVWRAIDLTLEATHRRKGWGRAVLAALQSSALKEDADGVDLHVALANTHARALYTSLGFRQAEPLGPYERMLWFSR